MVKARFREVLVNNGKIIELPDGILAPTILLDRRRSAMVVAWLEEVKE